MIAFLEGRIESTDSEGAVLLCGGIGFRLLCSALTRARLQQGEEARLLVVLQARDGDFRLYGFFDADERDAFRLLIGVQGVGGKLALAVLSRFDRTALARAIAEGDKASLQAVSGLGARTAQRLVSELEGKVDILPAAFDSRLPRDAHPSAPPSFEQRLWHDLVEALESLGFDRAETTRTLQALRREEEPATLDEALRKALRRLRPSSRPQKNEADETAASPSPARR